MQETFDGYGFKAKISLFLRKMNVISRNRCDESSFQLSHSFNNMVAVDGVGVTMLHTIHWVDCRLQTHLFLLLTQWGIALLIDVYWVMFKFEIEFINLSTYHFVAGDFLLSDLIMWGVQPVYNMVLSLSMCVYVWVSMENCVSPFSFGILCLVYFAREAFIYWNDGILTCFSPDEFGISLTRSTKPLTPSDECKKPIGK